MQAWMSGPYTDDDDHEGQAYLLRVFKMADLAEDGVVRAVAPREAERRCGLLRLAHVPVVRTAPLSCLACDRDGLAKLVNEPALAVLGGLGDEAVGVGEFPKRTGVVLRSVDGRLVLAAYSSLGFESGW